MFGHRLRPLPLLLLILLLAVLPLKDNRPADARATYSHVWQDFQIGYLALSQQEAESAANQFKSSDPAWAAQFTLLEADSMLYRGMYDDALRVLSGYSGSSTSDQGLLRKLAIEAVALTRQQQIAAADDRIARAEAVCRAADLPPCGDVLAARAILSAKLGQFDGARQSFLQALSFARRHSNPWLEAGTTLNLGYVAMQVNHYDESLDWSKQAYLESVREGYENFEQLAAGNLGWAYFQLGDDERALDEFDEAEKNATRIGSVRSQLKWLSDAGYIFRDSGDWARAAQSYRQALDLARQIDSKEDILNALQDLARLAVLRGNLDQADATIAQLTATESGGGLHPSATLRLTMGELASARGQRALAESYFHSVQNDSTAMMTTKLDAEFELARLRESQNNLAAADQIYRATLSMYAAARTQLKDEESQLPFGTNAAEIYDQYIELLVRQGRPDAALAVADQSRAQTLERGLGDPSGPNRLRSATLSPQEVARKTNSTLLFYWLGEKQSYLWAITGARTQLHILPPQQTITDLVERYRKALLDLKDPLEESNRDGQSLYRILLSPAAASLPRGSHLIILDDGILSQLNFETLLVPGTAGSTQPNTASNTELHYLLDDFVVSSAPSIAMLAAAKPATPAKPGILLMGNPVTASQDFPSLPMFGLEMSRIEDHFSSAEISALAGPYATPAAYFASDPHRYAYIHFVSHAVASSASPLDSAIILSNPAGREDAYKLYARAIIHYPIDAKLVTISACYGSGTRAYAGEGLVGLSWAFLRAGAQRVIGALWEVSDDSTPRLMDELYRGLTGGDSPEVALRNAKLSLLHSHSRFRLPYYWAPFQLYSRR